MQDIIQKPKHALPPSPNGALVIQALKVHKALGWFPEIRRDAFCMEGPSRPQPGWSVQFRGYSSQIPWEGWSACVLICPWTDPFSYGSHVTVLPKNLQELHGTCKITFELLPCSARPCMIWPPPEFQATHTLTHEATIVHPGKLGTGYAPDLERSSSSSSITGFFASSRPQVKSSTSEKTVWMVKAKRLCWNPYTPQHHHPLLLFPSWYTWQLVPVQISLLPISCNSLPTSCFIHHNISSPLA